MIAKLFTAWLYLSAFFQGVVVPCVTVPENWKYCSKDLDVWLYPELVRAWEISTEGICLYCEEKEKLNDSIQ